MAAPNRSRRRFRVVAVAASVAMVLTAAAPAQAAPGGSVTDLVLKQLIKHMTLEEKVGQLFVTQAWGESATNPSDADKAKNQEYFGLDTAAQIIQKYHPGGVILFQINNNTNNPQQIAGLTNGLQKAAISSGTHLPLLISTDQEQGIVARLREPATQFPGSMPVGASRNTTDACTAASITGQELRAVGINQNYSPDSDVNDNPANPVIGVRSYGADPALVASMASTAVRCSQKYVAATAKHFPGHGNADNDSHTGLPIIRRTADDWHKIDQPPFTADIAAGIDSIMTAHIEVPSLDPAGDPATLSQPILTGILRNQMHYDGVVVTDALNMDGVRIKYGDARVPVLALEAGVDQLLMPPKFDLAYNSVLDAVRSGELSVSRIEQSVLRVLRLKLKNRVLTQPFVNEQAVSRTVGTPQHLAAAQTVADHGITLIRNDDKVLPLAKSKKVLVTGWDNGVTFPTRAIAAGLTSAGIAATALPTGSVPNASAVASAVAAAQQNDVTVVVTRSSLLALGASQVALTNALIATGKPVVVVAVQNPYDIGYVPTARNYVASYYYGAVSSASLARVLAGTVAPTGKLPVRIPSPADLNTTLYPIGYGIGY
ncbi:glycoside hydrolase family 3 protein [Fodinicola acaciae]|uniref:glycoside hydrolase family 3 protein n=1 Tax=Fodinicola acaciae TaxID=2681555 RepID=UPI0013D14020|nr:glycoside hydrolase family 3 protein [Fodinicola acaciae]